MSGAQHLVVSNIDPLTIDNFDRAVAEIEASLFNMRFLAVETNFDDPAQRQRFRDNVVQLKRFYERAERLALDDEQKNPSSADGSLDQQAPKANVKVFTKRKQA